jgi:ankyrin repeat protein
LNVGINPLIKNKNGNTCLHICAYCNNYACAGIILSKLEALNEKNKIVEILCAKNKIGDTPLHISSENNLENISLLFISYLMRNNIKLEMIKNSSGLNPLQLSIKNHNYKLKI